MENQIEKKMGNGMGTGSTGFIKGILRLHRDNGK